MATEIVVCLDLGNDTLKLSFAYASSYQDVYGKLMLPDLINQVAIPAAACYDDDAHEWRYAEELDYVDNNRFSTVVKIKSLLSIFTQQKDKITKERNQLYYREEHYFPKFCFPIRHRMRSDFQYLVDQKLVFEAPEYTPQDMCEEFFSHVRKIVESSISELSAQTGVEFEPLQKIALVCPPKQGEAYIEELARLVNIAFDKMPTKILTSTQALGLLAFHQGLIDNGERVLLFDMGDETVSVTKAWLNEIGQNVREKVSEGTVGILVDSPAGHSAPLDFGGCDIDEEIASYLESCIQNRETVGSPSADMEGHIYETGMCASQYLLMKDIKKAKMVMPLTVGGIFKNGVPISIHRETLVQRLLTAKEFFSCVGIDNDSGVANRVLNYILSELSRSVNRDVTKIIFAGGTIESFGLLDFLTKNIHSKYPNVKVITFENSLNDGNRFSIQFFETATYAAAIGGAIVAMKDYSVDPVLSYSYGTWLYHGRSKNKHLKLFAERGDLLLDEENRFSMNAVINVGRTEQEFLEGDELFSTIINSKEISEYAYADKVSYEEEWLIVGEAGDEDRLKARNAIDLRVVAGGKGAEIHFYYMGERVAISSRYPKEICFEEGFIVDKKGLAKPFFSNLKSKNDTDVIVRLLSDNSSMLVNASSIEFRLCMNELMVATNT